MSVRELLAAPPAAVALRLRSSLQEATAETIAARARWLRQAHRGGARTPLAFDARALTFVLSRLGLRLGGR